MWVGDINTEDGAKMAGHRDLVMRAVPLARRNLLVLHWPRLSLPHSSEWREGPQTPAVSVCLWRDAPLSKMSNKKLAFFCFTHNN